MRDENVFKTLGQQSGVVLKNHKRLSLLILIVLSVVVTWYIEMRQPEVPQSTRDLVEAELLKDPTFPARPVWWEKGYLLGVGVLPNGENRDAEARQVCTLMLKQGISPAEVHVFDVLQIQNDDKWEQVGGAVCKL